MTLQQLIKDLKKFRDVMAQQHKIILNQENLINKGKKVENKVSPAHIIGGLGNALNTLIDKAEK